MEVGSLTLYAIIAIVSLVLFLIKNNDEYWKKRNIPHVEANLFTRILKQIRQTVGFYEIYANIYNKFKGTGPFAGFFMLTTPSVVVLELDLAKNILIKDFNNFEDRGLFHNERDDPLSGHLFALEGLKWKILRGKLSPAFTPGKMKSMFPTIVSVGEKFLQVLEKETSTNPDIEVREILARFTTDIIGMCAFGIDCNSLNDPNAEFRIMANKAIGSNQSKFGSLFTDSFPRLSRFLGLKRIPHGLAEFFTGIVQEIVMYREKNNIKRNDFMDLLIDLKNKRQGPSDSDDVPTTFTMKEIVAQWFIFFLASFETSSKMMSFALYELAQHEEIQNRLRKEINDVVTKYDGNFTYDGIKEMAYLDQVIGETLRMYSPASVIRRKAKADYQTSDPKYVIPKDAHVVVPIFGIQNDPDIYPNPRVFDPERFTPDEIQKRHPMAWLPFGDGPRNCVGLSFGRIQSRVGLAMLIKNFKFSVANDTPIPMSFSKKALILTSDRGVVLKVQKI